MKEMPIQQRCKSLKVFDKKRSCTLYLKNGLDALSFVQKSRSKYCIISYLNIPPIYIFTLFACAVAGPLSITEEYNEETQIDN